MAIQKLQTSLVKTVDGTQYVGEANRVFFDIPTRTFRLSDEATPGGIVIGSGGGGGGSMTVKQVQGNGGTVDLSVPAVTEIQFDKNTGFNVTDNGFGRVFVELGSSFKDWYVAGQTTLSAVGEDSVEFIAGSGIQLTTTTSHTGSATKALTITATGGGGGTTVDPQFTNSITINSDEATDPVNTQFFVYYGSTTDATTTRLYKDSSNTSIAVPQQTTMFFEADIVGRNDTTPDYGAFKVKGVIDNNSGGNTSIIMNQKEIMHAGTNELFDANIVADNALDLLAVEVNGEAATNIRWSALVKVVSVKQT